jgi:hypothetical protein
MAQSKGLNEAKVSLARRWTEAQPTKTMVFWLVVVSIILTMIVGFSWAGWVTGGTALKTANTASSTAVIERLTSICVSQFDQDPAKAEKLQALKDASTYQQTGYVTDQGWATMPGEEKADSKVANACAKRLAQTD